MIQSRIIYIRFILPIVLPTLRISWYYSSKTFVVKSPSHGPGCSFVAVKQDARNSNRSRQPLSLERFSAVCDSLPQNNGKLVAPSRLYTADRCSRPRRRARRDNNNREEGRRRGRERTPYAHRRIKFDAAVINSTK